MASWKSVGIGGGFIKNEHLVNRTITDVIAAIDVGEYDGQPQLIAELLSENKKVAFNEHSCKLLEAAYGEDYEKWISQKVTISLQQVTVMGQPKLIKVIAPVAPPPAAARKGKK